MEMLIKHNAMALVNDHTLIVFRYRRQQILIRMLTQASLVSFFMIVNNLIFYDFILFVCLSFYFILSIFKSDKFQQFFYQLTKKRYKSVSLSVYLSFYFILPVCP
jgi:hypothetical protein